MIDQTRLAKVAQLYPVLAVTEDDILGKSINLNAGVMCGKYHWGKSDAMEVYMYLSFPGKYFTINGAPLPESFAANAGFDTHRYSIARQSNQMREEAEQVIKARLAIKDDVPAFEHNGYKVLAPNGLGHAQIMDPYGNRLQMQPIPVEDAIDLVKRLTSYVEPEVEADAPTEE